MSSTQTSDYSQREKVIAEFAYERGFWEGVQAARSAEVVLPEGWEDDCVGDTLSYIRTILERRGL